MILVDDAHAMPGRAPALAVHRKSWVRASRSPRAGAANPARVPRVRLAIDVVLLAGASGRESRRYVEMRLAYGGAASWWRRSTTRRSGAAPRVARVPRRLNQAAEGVVRRSCSQLPRARAHGRAGGRTARGPGRGSCARAGGGQSAVPEGGESARSAARPCSSRARRRAARHRWRHPHRRDSGSPIGSAAVRTRAARTDLARANARRRAGAARRGRRRRGILLPEIFDRVPGEPAGGYRIVRGAPIAPTPPRAEPPASLRARTSVPERCSSRLPSAPMRRRGDSMPSAYADRVPPPRAHRAAPVRLIGIAGFLLGIAFSMTWMLSSDRQPPSKPNVSRPAPTAVAAPPVQPAGPIIRRAPCRSARPRRDRACRSRSMRAIVSVTAARSARRRSRASRSGGPPRLPGAHAHGTTRQQTIDMKPGRSTVLFR